MKILPLPVSQQPDAGQLAERLLRESPYYFLRQLKCHYLDGILTLRGRVPFHQLVTCAETIVSRVDGVEAVVNCLEVGEPAAMAGSMRRGA
jgi:osmotically-inducible protein OsmY